jgi:hypothetical protein
MVHRECPARLEVRSLRVSETGSASTTVLHEDSGTVETSYSCLALRAWDEETLQGAVPANNTLLTILEGTSDRIEDLVVNTADQWGPFHVTTRLYEEDPGDPGDAWEDVVEMSLTSASSLIVTELVDNDPQIELLPGAGQYRLRVSARGRRIRDLDPDDGELDEDTPPKEWYLLEAWLAPAAEPVVVRLTSPFAQHELNPPPPVVIPEGEAGLAASERIGRDVERLPGARTLSGELGSVQAQRTIRGTRRRLFGWCSHLVTWSHVWLPAPSWSWSGGSGDEYDPHQVHWASAHSHPDQLSGSTGSIRCSYVDVKKPAYAIRSWNWMVSPDGGRNMRFDARVPVLAEDAQMTVELTETKDADKQAWTTIRITHTGLPVEWLDDMETYWTYQLSIADHANFGIPK